MLIIRENAPCMKYWAEKRVLPKTRAVSMLFEEACFPYSVNLKCLTTVTSN